MHYWWTRIRISRGQEVKHENHCLCYSVNNVVTVPLWYLMFLRQATYINIGIDMN